MKVKYRKKNRLQRLIFLIGLPATGKSTIAKYLNQRKSYEVLSVDKFIQNLSRAQDLPISDTIENNKEEIQREISRQISVIRACNSNAIIDLPNLTVADRRSIMKEINSGYKKNCDKIAIYFHSPLEGILERNIMKYLAKQDHSEISIRSMFETIQAPREEEFDYVIVVNDHEILDYQRDYLHTLQNT